MWGAKSEPVIQFLHFWYTVGGAVINFIMEPFLNEVDTTLNGANTTLNGMSHVCSIHTFEIKIIVFLIMSKLWGVVNFAVIISNLLLVGFGYIRYLTVIYWINQVNVNKLII